MKLGTKGRYAVMALADLSLQGQDKPVNIAEVAQRQNLSVAYLEQLFGRLRRSGLIKSIRGQGGGYLLSTEPEDISINDIFQAVGEPIKTTACNPEAHEGCLGSTEKCMTHHLWVGLSQVMADYLEGVTLADMCRKAPRSSDRNVAA